MIPRPELLAKYRVHLSTARQAITDVADAVRGHRASLLCYERHPGECHRSLLSKRIARRLSTKIIDL